MREGAAALLFAAALVLPWEAEAGERGAAAVPRATVVAGRELRLNGAAVQTRFWFQIYTVALYLEEPVRSAAEAIAADRPKALRLVLHHHAHRSQVASALRDGMRRAGVDLAALQPRLDRLLAAIPDMQPGEWLQIDYRPGEGTLLRDRHGRSLRVEGKDFADALFAVWLGEAPEMARIRRGLLAGPPPPAAQARTPSPSRP